MKFVYILCLVAVLTSANSKILKRAVANCTPSYLRGFNHCKQVMKSPSYHEDCKKTADQKKGLCVQAYV